MKLKTADALSFLILLRSYSIEEPDYSPIILFLGTDVYIMLYWLHE